MTAPTSTLREFDVSAKSTDVFGRVQCSARNHHFIIDGPVYNGCPGEAITPVEAFLTSVAACGVELIDVIAKDEGTPLDRIAMDIHGAVDRTKQARDDVTTFNLVRVDATLWGKGLTQEKATALVNGFRRRCPLMGTVAIAAAEVQVRVTVGA